MSETLSYSRPIPLRHDVDLLVCGGGPAGFAASVAAARAGASVLLAEAGPCLGGTGTAGGICILCANTDGVHDLSGGICADIIRRLVEAGFGPEGFRPEDFASRRFWYDIEGAKLVLDRMAREAGVRVLFGTRAVDVLREGDRVRHVVLAAKSGLFAVRAKLVVDATGDGDVAAFAGVPFEMGDAEGRCQAGTLPSVWSGIDWDRAEAAGNGIWTHDRFLPEAIREGMFSQPDPHMPGMVPMTRQSGMGNIGHVFGVDATDESSLSAAFVRGREQLREYERYYRRYLAGFERARLASTGSLFGIRESRRIRCDYMLCADDHAGRRHFPDEIACGCHPIDAHPASLAPTDVEASAESFRKRRLGLGETYGIPWRSLLPLGVSNLAVAGRCIGTDHLMQSSVRVMPTCYATGQAAGVAAALALAKDGPPSFRRVSPEPLRERLRALGAYLP